jgi:hypothetical protein
LQKIGSDNDADEHVGAFIVKGMNEPQVQVLSKDYAFSSLKHGLHVLDRAHYWMIMPTSKV